MCQVNGLMPPPVASASKVKAVGRLVVDRFGGRIWGIHLDEFILESWNDVYE